ncbi:tetratricopeptide repeat protein [Synechococcus sp. Nb3U1]|uniref:tetratricopeptide repeat protein n=1 Tax=Synechococcus sp. Nb3U1 TaxID=1914529 RepID=UPI001F3F5629|nr:tetratricopeptide repeat protein [Synechococcus sp. Nb3U1]MCF2972456.1 tetratricopeptide repeat protein [Synechococcus sp. Nb3U1]
MEEFDKTRIEQLLVALKQERADLRQEATEALWELWFGQKGIAGRAALEHSQLLMDSGQLGAAETLLSELIDQLPDFVEAWNRRAVLYYTLKRYPEAVRDCEMVVKLCPIHFGAWHGLGLCRAAMQDYRGAIAAFQKALDIQPYALINQRLLLECTALLS